MNCFMYTLVLMVTLTASVVGLFKSDSSDEKYVIAHSIIRNVKNELSKKYNMSLCSVSEATHRDDELYTEIGIGFDIRRPISKEEGRQVMVESAEEFLRQINNHPEFRQYMHEYPFQPANIELKLYISDTFGRELFSPDISLISLRKGIISFKTYSREKSNYVVEGVEDWEEAKKIVKAKS